MIEFGEDFITIYTKDRKTELVTWVEDEWVEDSSLVLSIANAIKMYYENYTELLIICGFRWINNEIRRVR